GPRRKTSARLSGRTRAAPRPGPISARRSWSRTPRPPEPTSTRRWPCLRAGPSSSRGGPTPSSSRRTPPGRSRPWPPSARAGGGLVAWRILRAILRERTGDIGGAREDLDAAVAAAPESPGLYALRATVRYKGGDSRGSVADAHEALQRHPENMDGFVRMLY